MEVPGSPLFALADPQERDLLPLPEYVASLSMALRRSNHNLTIANDALKLSIRNEEALNEKVEDMERELDDLRRKLMAAERDNASEQSRSRELEARVARLSEDMTDGQRKLYEQNRQAAQQVEEYKRECVVLTEKVASALNELRNEQSRSRELETRVAHAQQDAKGAQNRAHEQNMQLMSQVEEWKRKHAKLGRGLIMTSAAAKALSAERAKLERSVAELSANFARELEQARMKAADAVRRHAAALQQERDAMASELRGEVDRLATSLEKEQAEREATVQRLRREMTERRKLYNKLQELRGNVRVYTRVRPTFSGAKSCVSVCDEAELSLALGNGKMASYEFDRVFGPETLQQTIFEDMQPLITSVLDGYNVCVFAYGCTGSGKTYTMVGPVENRGVNFRSLTELVKTIEAERKIDYQYEMTVSMVEIYCDEVRDLLADTDGGPPKRLTIQRLPDGTVTVPGAFTMAVNTVDDIVNVMTIGNVFRVMAATELNDHSSRSHTVLTVHVSGRHRVTGDRYAGKLSLIDLAGSEEVSRSHARGQQLVEADHINASLGALAACFDALAAARTSVAPPPVPFHRSRLTELLSDSLGGDAKVAMFLHVNPEEENAEEVRRSMEFGTHVRAVELGQAKQCVNGRKNIAVPGAAAAAAAAAGAGATGTGAKGQYPQHGASGAGGGLSLAAASAPSASSQQPFQSFSKKKFSSGSSPSASFSSAAGPAPASNPSLGRPPTGSASGAGARPASSSLRGTSGSALSTPSARSAASSQAGSPKSGKSSRSEPGAPSAPVPGGLSSVAAQAFGASIADAIAAVTRGQVSADIPSPPPLPVPRLNSSPSIRPLAPSSSRSSGFAR
eukprot:tig00021374_g21124.t1